jgi:hypothetical protein
MSKKKLLNIMARKTSNKPKAKNVWQSNINKIEEWLTGKGYRLIRGKEKHVVDSVDFEAKIVFLGTRSTEENQFYSILHECGHIVNRTKNTFAKKYKVLKESETDPRKQKSLRYLVEEIEEETEAWRNGEVLSNKLDIQLDSEKYYTYASKFLMGYIVMAGEGKQYVLGRPKNKKSK